MESTNYWKCILNFLSSLLTKWQWLFQQPVTAHTQILVHRWHLEQGFWHFFTDRMNQSLVSTVSQAIILWDCRENFSHDDGTIIHSHLVYFTSYYLSFLPTKYTRFIIFISSPSPPPQKNINSVSSRYGSIMTGHQFLLVSAASREPCILLCTCTVGKIHYCVNPEFMLLLYQ